MSRPAEIVERAPADLKPWPGNPRTHSEKQVAKLKASIEAFGFTAPVLVDEAGVILSGHGRVQAAKALGLERIPTRVLSGLSETKKRAYVIADNKIAQLSEWDKSLLKSELETLIGEEFAVETTGFSTAEIDLMMFDKEVAGGADSDDPQEEDVPAEVVSRPGDLWQLGHHRLLCGDAMQPESYRSLMGEERAQLVFSHPPPEQLVGAVFSMTHEVSRRGAIHFYCVDWRHIGALQKIAQPVFGAPRQLCVWVKENAAGGTGLLYRRQHEFVLVFKRGNAPHINNFELGQHGRYRTNVWTYPGVKRAASQLEPTIKPVGLVADALRDCSKRDGVVLDPFAGSGTLLVAAERTGRRARAIELDPHYVDVGLARWQRVTGQEATLQATGQTWAAAAAARAERQAAPAQRRRKP